MKSESLVPYFRPQAARLVALLPLLAAGASLRAAGAEGERGPFRPEEALPPGALLHASVGSMEGLRERVATTFSGRLALHPAFRPILASALAPLDEGLGRWTREVLSASPADLLSLVDLLRGDVLLAVGGPGGEPGVVLALDIEPRREEVLSFLARLDRAVEEKAGAELPRLVVGRAPIALWPTPCGRGIGRVVVGAHAVFTSPSDRAAAIVAAHRKGPGSGEGVGAAGAAARAKEGARGLALLEDMRRKLAADAADLVLVLDCQALRGVRPGAGAELPGPGAELPGRGADLLRQLRENLRAAGIETAASLGLLLGVREGALEAALRLEPQTGLGGAAGAAAAALEPLDRGLEDLLSAVPVSSSGVAALRLAPGRLLAGLLAAGKGAGAARNELASIEARLGLSIERDLGHLTPVTVLLFSQEPPAGSLVPDRIALLRRSEVEPLRQLLARLEALAPSRRIEEVGRTIHAGPLGAWMELERGLLAFSASPAALRRFAGGLTEPRLAAARAGEIRSRLEGAAMAAVLTDDRRPLLGLYNTAVWLAVHHPDFRERLEGLGGDPALLPPGEDFLEEPREGFLRLELDPGGLTLRARRLGGGAPWLAAAASDVVAIALRLGSVLGPARPSSSGEPGEGRKR